MASNAKIKIMSQGLSVNTRVTLVGEDGREYDLPVREMSLHFGNGKAVVARMTVFVDVVDVTAPEWVMKELRRQ